MELALRVQEEPEVAWGERQPPLDVVPGEPSIGVHKAHRAPLDLAQECEALRVALAEAERNEDIAPGFREQSVFLERFGLRAADLSLFSDGDTDGATAAPVHLRTDFEEAAAVHLRNTFRVFVMENKVLAGREVRHATDAQTRPLVVCFCFNEPLALLVSCWWSGLTPASQG